MADEVHSPVNLTKVLKVDTVYEYFGKESPDEVMALIREFNDRQRKVTEQAKSSETPVADFLKRNPDASPLDVFTFALHHIFSAFTFANPEVEIEIINQTSSLTRSWLCQ
jgi:hypothetical protein